MPEDAPRPTQSAIRTELGAIFVSLELSRRAWLVASLSPGSGEKMSNNKHSVPASEVSGLLRRFAELRRKAAVFQHQSGTPRQHRFKWLVLRPEFG
jgi:transposase